MLEGKGSIIVSTFLFFLKGFDNVVLYQMPPKSISVQTVCMKEPWIKELYFLIIAYCRLDLSLCFVTMHVQISFVLQSNSLKQAKFRGSLQKFLRQEWCQVSEIPSMTYCKLKISVLNPSSFVGTVQMLMLF